MSSKSANTKTQALENFVLPERSKRLREVAANRTNQTTLVLEEIRNAHNISAVLRSADAFGIRDLYLVGNKFEYSSGISLGTERWVNILTFDKAEQAARELKNKGYELAVMAPPSLAPAGPQLAVHEMPFEKKLALVFGNEVDGVSQAFVSQADYFSYIPMLGFVESLNVSVAAAITLYCSLLSSCKFGRKAKGLDEAEEEELVLSWLRQDVKCADKILTRLELD